LQHRFGLGFGFYFSKNPVFGWVLGFSIFKKKWKFSGKIVMKEEKNLRKSFNSSNLLQCIGLQNRLATECWSYRTDPTDLWQVGPKSVDDGFYANDFVLYVKP
jgi:hypothetical protein